jgi:hypothetical protein
LEVVTMSATLACLAALAALAPPVVPCPPVDEAPYVIVRTARLERLERLVNEAAAGGRRLLASSATGERAGTVLFHEADKISVLMGPDPDSPGPHEYVLLDGDLAFRKLQRRLSEQAARGFRFHPQGLVIQSSDTPLGSGERHVLLLERGNDREPREYAIELVGKSKRSLRQLSARLQEGFRLAGLARAGSIAAAVLERPGGQARGVTVPTGRPREFRVLQAWTRKRMARQLTQAAAEGYTYVGGAGVGLRMLLLERTRGPRDACELHLPRGRHDDFAETLSGLGREGFRIEPRSLSGGWLVLTRPPTHRSACLYRFVTERHREPACPATAEAVEEGYEIIGLSWPVVLLERCEEPAD